MFRILSGIALAQAIDIGELEQEITEDKKPGDVAKHQIAYH